MKFPNSNKSDFLSCRFYDVLPNLCRSFDSRLRNTERSDEHGLFQNIYVWLFCWDYGYVPHSNSHMDLFLNL